MNKDVLLSLGNMFTLFSLLPFLKPYNGNSTKILLLTYNFRQNTASNVSTYFLSLKKNPLKSQANELKPLHIG